MIFVRYHCCVSDWRRRTELPGPNIPLPCGYQPIAEHFAEGLDVRFGQRVQRVAYDGAGVRVTTEDGSELAADAVIVTVSLGVLKAWAAPRAELRRGLRGLKYPTLLALYVQVTGTKHGVTFFG
jgi:protoporphyrinogen oxidase